jgi:NAD(P)-dependent dehydrogenase (short-subunit alcohol dehydrogenase family)
MLIEVVPLTGRTWGHHAAAPAPACRRLPSAAIEIRDEVEEGEPPARRVAVVTGGSGAIGLACGAELVRRGFEVVLTARGADRLREVAAGIGATAVAADSTDEDSFAAVAAARDRIDVLVLAAGVLDGTFVRKETLATWDGVISANLRSAYVATRATLPKMPAGGRIFLISSTAASAPMKGLTAYSASKAGLEGFAGALAREVARDGIQVHILAPGPVLTPMLRTPKFPMHVITVDDVAHVLGFLTELRPQVVLPEIRFWGAEEGPFESDVVEPAPRGGP